MAVKKFSVAELSTFFSKTRSVAAKVNEVIDSIEGGDNSDLVVDSLSTDTINENTSGAGVTVDGVLLKDSTVKTDTIVEKTSAAGVTIDSTLLKDGGITTSSSSSAIIGGLLVLSETPQTLSGAGAVNVTTKITLVVTTGANALTLADGTAGQIKIITMKTDGGDGTLTPAHLRGGTTITFNDVGDTVVLLFIDSTWIILSNFGCTVA